MRKTLNQIQLVAVIALSCWQLGSTCAAQDQKDATPTKPAPAPAATQAADIPLAINQRPDVFHNYYLQPSMDGTAASMYPAPHPVPARVGSTQFTYQPLLPREYMYRHDRVYYTPHGTRDMFYADPCNCKMRGQTYTKTSVMWGYGSNQLSPMPLQLPSFGRKFWKSCGPTCR